MAIVIKRKPATTTTIAESMTQRQEAAMIAIGLMPEKEVEKPPDVKAPGVPKEGLIKPPKGVGKIPVGARVKMDHELFPWFKPAKVGDTGEVIKVWPSPPSIPSEDAEQYLLYEVKMDAPRVPGNGSVLFRSWELAILE